MASQRLHRLGAQSTALDARIKRRRALEANMSMNVTFAASGFQRLARFVLVNDRVPSDDEIARYAAALSKQATFVIFGRSTATRSASPEAHTAPQRIA